MVILGQGWLIFKLTGSALQLGYLGAAASIPSILLVILGGAIADRYDKRALLIIASGLNMLLLTTLATLDYLHIVEVWHVLSVAMLISLITGIEWPTRTAFFPHLIERKAMLSAVALGSFIWQSTRMMMPALGGYVIASWGTWTIFALGALGYSYMFMTIFTMQVHVPGEKHKSTWQQAKEGFRYVFDNAIFAWLILLAIVCMFFGNAYMQLMPVFADLLGSNERGFGYLLSASGLGSILGTLAVISVQHSQRLGLIILGGAAGMAICLLGFWLSLRSGSFCPAMLSTLLASACGSTMMISSMTVMQMKVPDRLRGRVNGIHSISFSMIPLGGLFLGMLTSQFDAPTAILIGASVCLLFSIYVYMRKPIIRNIDGREFQHSSSIGDE